MRYVQAKALNLNCIAEAVSHIAICEDIGGFRGVVLNLFPQLVYYDAKVFSFLSIG
jgi:hypothetical protein